MSGGKNKQPLGYTIIEVMIVLAVSGLMFVIAAGFISGKQEKASFTAGVTEMSSRIQDVIEQVVDGRYSDIPMDCSVGPSNLSFSNPVSVGPNGNQGMSQKCVFLGKMMHFSEHGTWSAGSDPNHYEVFSISSARLDSSGQIATSLDASVPTPIDPAFSSGPNLTIQSTIPQNLSVQAIKVNTNINTYSFGFLQSQGTYNGGVLQNGAQSVNMVYSNQITTAGQSESAAAAGLINSGGSSRLRPADKAAICVTDGTQYAMITVGSNNAQLSASVKRLGTTACQASDY